MSVVALTSKTSSRIKDDILSDVGQPSSSTAHADRLRVVTGVDLLAEDTVERAAKEAELGKSARLIVCLAGEVGGPLQPKPCFNRVACIAASRKVARSSRPSEIDAHIPDEHVGSPHAVQAPRSLHSDGSGICKA